MREVEPRASQMMLSSLPSAWGGGGVADFKGLESEMQSELLTEGQVSGSALTAGSCRPCVPGAEFQLVYHLVDRNEIQGEKIGG